MKIVERSEKRAGPFILREFCRGRPMRCIGTPPSTRIPHGVALQTVAILCVAAKFTPTHSGW
jgi:hypothetical protein